MWEFFINNRRFSYLIIAALLGFGIFSLQAIPKESSPEVQIPVGIVTTLLPGAPAVDVESLITNELERGLSGSLENVKRITSTSQESVSSIVVEFIAGADIDDSIRKLRDKVETLVTRLPADAERPVVSEVNFVDQPIVTLAIAGNRTPEEFSVIAEALAKNLEGVNGVSRVEKNGVREREVTVLLNESDLLRFNLSVGEVISSLRTANSLFPVGQIVTDGVSYNITLAGGIDEVGDVASVPIAVRGGQPVLISDVATIDTGLGPVSTETRLSIAGKPAENAFTVDVYKLRGGDITVIAEDILARSALLQSSGLLEDLTVYPVLNAGEQINTDLVNLTTSGLITIVLVISLLVIAIGWREGLLAGLAIPLSFTIGFIGLYLSGNTINFLSLFALILGIGVLVDSGIVVVEGIHRKMVEGNVSRIKAAKDTIREYAAPLTAGTLTTVAMFAGLFVVGGVTGQFISSIPFTLIFILFASLLVALGFLPIIAASVLKPHKLNALEEKQESYFHRLEDWYRNKLKNLLANGKKQTLFIVLIVVGFFTAIALIPAGLVKVTFFEQSNTDELFLEIELPVGTVRGTTDLATRAVEEVLYQKEVISAFSVTIGSGSAFGGGGANTRLANIFIALDKDREFTSLEFSDELRKELAVFTDFKVSIAQPDAGPPTGSAIGVKLIGDDLDKLALASLSVKNILNDITGTQNVETSAGENNTEFVITIDKVKAAAFGLNPSSISQTLRTAVFGSQATSITTLTDDIDVVVRLNLTDDETTKVEFANYTSIDRLAAILIATPTGNEVPISSVTTIGLREANNVIRHENQDRIMTVSAGLASEGNVREINAEITKALNQPDVLPLGVSFSLGGEAEESNQAFGELFLALIIGVVLMVGILVLQFDSYRHTLYVLSILPFSLIGILYGLAITGSSLSFPSILGFIALSGIIVNNSILLIDQMNNRRRQNANEPISDLVVEASVSRLRAILLTSSTTIAGMIPLLFTDEIWIPLATAIIFGLAFSVVITLVLVPVIYNKWPGTMSTSD